MEHFRNETLEYFGGERGEKHCVKVSNNKKKKLYADLSLCCGRRITVL